MKFYNLTNRAARANCELRKRHRGDHRFVNYTWAGPGMKVVYLPKEPARG